MFDATPTKNAFESSDYFISNSAACFNEINDEAKKETKTKNLPKLEPQQCVRNFLPIFINYARKNIWKKDEQEDFIQDSVLILLESLNAGKIKNQSSIRSYCLGICKRHLLVYIRNLAKHSRFRIGIDTSEFENFPDDANETLRYEDQQQCVDLLKNIRVSRDRELLIDFYIEDKSRAEILDKFGFDDAHLYRVLYRAKQRARDVLITQNTP